MAIPSSGCRALEGRDSIGDRTRLVLKQVDGVGRVVPEQVVGPAATFAEGVLVFAAEEERLRDEVLEFQLTGLDLVVDPLV